MTLHDSLPTFSSAGESFLRWARRYGAIFACLAMPLIIAMLALSWTSVVLQRHSDITGRPRYGLLVNGGDPGKPRLEADHYYAIIFAAPAVAVVVTVLLAAARGFQLSSGFRQRWLVRVGTAALFLSVSLLAYLALSSLLIADALGEVYV